jgi:hypothetical protein
VEKTATKQMPVVYWRAGRFWAHSAAIATKYQENPMENIEDIREPLQGQIEGLAQCMLVFGAALQHKGLVDVQDLQAMLRRRSDALPSGMYGLAPAQRLMTHLADELQKVFLQDQDQKKLAEKVHPNQPQGTGHHGLHQ